jgi:hypothetical protein
MIRLEPKPKSRGLKRSPLKRKPLIRKPPKVSWLTKNPPKLRKTAKTKTPKISWLSRTKPLKPMSKNMIKQRREENKLSLKLAELSGNRCEICGKPPDFRGLHKHEIIKRSHQGSEILATNCLLLCLECHNHRKYPKSGTPLSIEEQLVLAKKLHENIL